MTRLLGALFALVAACGGALVVQAPAQAACSCTSAGAVQDAADADAVFAGTVRETRKPAPDDGGGAEELYTYVVDVDRVYQQVGTVVTETVKVSSPRTGSCGLGNLPAGAGYVFFATARDAGFRAGACGGSAPVTEELVAEVEGALGPGKQMVPDDESPELVLTAVESSAPQSVTRLAAPGVAVALLGLLGLVLVRVAGSRR